MCVCVCCSLCLCCLCCSIDCLRHYREFFGVTFKLKADTANKTVLASVLGIGFKNFSRKTI